MNQNRTPRLSDLADVSLTRLAVDELRIPADQWLRGHRKWWEWAMVLLAAERSGAVRPDARILGVGSGHETPIYWFANRIRQMVATDLYGGTSFKAAEATDVMMVDPAQFAPFEYERSGLQVQRVDARELPFAASTFDFAFSCSSIEHFGCDADVARSVAEVYRVLKPGGRYALAVDFIFGEGRRPKPRRRRKGLLGELLTASDVERLIINSTPFRLTEPIEFDAVASDAVVDLSTNSAPNEQFPHLWLGIGDAQFTSLFLVLHKPESHSNDQRGVRANLLGL